MLRLFFALCTALHMGATALGAYPIDGYELTGIRRLERLRLVVEGALKGPVLTVGSRRPLEEVQLNLLADSRPALDALPAADPRLQEALDRLFDERDPSYALALLDITPGRPLRLAQRHWERRFEPGSVGKLAVAAGLFAELQRLFPDDPEKRRQLLRQRRITADAWIVHDDHEVPLYDPETRQFSSRPIREGDEFSLYEWADHMLSASSNAAASTVWKELMLMRHFGSRYPPSAEEEEEFFSKTRPLELQRLSVAIVNEPLRQAGIPQSEWQLGTFFTRTGKRRVPGTTSWATPRGMLLYLLRLEQGRVVDPWSSLEIKRLMYMTAKRIRYASSPQIARSRVYFKSGSLYRCQPEPGYHCRKYMGNKDNIMNSVAAVETSDGRVYLVALTSNVLRKNSAVDHQSIAGDIEHLMK